MKIKFRNFFNIFVIISISVFFINNADVFSTNVIPGGTAVGITIKTDGLIVTDTDKVYDTEGKAWNVANSVGIKKGDKIVCVNNEKILSCEDFSNAINNSGGNVILGIVRGDKDINVEVLPIKTNTGKKIGVWVRDSAAGLGTITCVDVEKNKFYALGHGISDADSNILLPVSDGNIYNCIQTGVTKSEKGVPGELNGYIGHQEFGKVIENTKFGMCGEITDSIKIGSEVVETAKDDEIKIGNATILADVDGTGVKEYSIRINRLLPYNTNGKNMVIKITDSELIKKTGGIVQGMSGAPIIQNGKLIGAVTHVFVNNPEKGYGIFIDKMMS